MRLYLLVLGLVVFVSYSVTARDYTEEDYAKDIRYIGQTTIECEGRQYKIPPYLPHMTDKNGDLYQRTYMNLHRARCEDDSLDIEWGIDKGCNGANVCGMGGFYFDKISSRFREFIGMGDGYESVKIPKYSYAYYYPSKCYAYCSQARLVWHDGDVTYMLRIKMGEKEEMVKSAQSYMDMIKADDN